MFKAVPIKIPMIFIKETEKIYLIIHLETQETTNRQGNTQLKEQRSRYHNTRLQTIFQSYSHENSMALAQKQM
jgi:hypothetical protein